MDKELLQLLNEARAAGANESQMDLIVNAYNQKKKNLATGGGNQTDVLEEPLSDTSVGVNGQLQQSVPAISQLPLQEDNKLPTSFDLTFTKKPVVNIAGVNVGINAPIQDVSPIPEVASQETLTQQLQNRINTKTYTPEDIGVVAQSMDVSLPAASAYMKGDVGTGTVIHFNDVKATKQEQLKSTVAKANQELGLADTYEEVFSSPDVAGAYIQKIEQLYQSKANQEANASTVQAQKDNPTLFALGSIYVDKSQSRQTLNAAQEIKGIVSNEIIDKISEDTTLTTDQKVQKIYSLVDSRDKANVKKAIDQRLSPLRYMIDVATGGNTTQDIDLLNANKAGIEFKLNQSLKDKLHYNYSLQKSILEEYAAKVDSQEISAEDEKAKEYYDNRWSVINDSNIGLRQQIVPDKDLYQKYPVLYKSAIANSVNEYNAIKSGNVVGFEDGGYEGVSLNEHLAAQGFDVKDQKVQDFLDGDNFKDYSFFGRPIKNVVEVFTNTAKSLGDITQIRDEADVLSEKRKAEMFPTQVGANDELKLTTTASTAQNIANTTGQVLGQGLLQAGTAGVGRMMGLSKVAANGAAFWTSGTLTSYDQAYKDSYDFVDSGVGRTAYAGLIALANGASERIFPEVKLFQIPGVQDALANVAKRVGTKEFTTELSNELLGKAKNAFVDYAVKYGKNIGQETVEEVATDIFESSTRFLFGDPNISAEKAIESAKNTAIQTAIGTSLIGGFGAHRDVQAERNVSAKSTIYNAAIYHDEALDAINLGFSQNLYGEYERDAKIAVLNTAREAVNVMDKTEKIEGKTLKRPERELYVANLTAEAVLKGQKQGMDEVGQKAIDEKVSNLQNQRQQILKGEVLIDDNGNITTPTIKPVQSEEVTTEVQATETTIPESTESVSETTTAAEPTILEPTEESGIVVQPPMFIPKPITIGGTEEIKTPPETTEPIVTPEVKTEPLPPTESKNKDVVDRQETPINIDEIGEGFILHRGGKTGTSEGFNSLDKSRAEGYGGKEGGITSSVIKKDAKILKLVSGDTENYKDNEADINEFYKIIGESERQKGSEWADGEMLTDITTRLLNNKSAVDKLKKAGIDIVIGETIDGPDAFIVNEKAVEKITPKSETKPSLPSTVKSEEVNDAIKLKNGEELSVILSDKTKGGDYFEMAINDKEGNQVATASFALNKENNKYTPLAVEITNDKYKGSDVLQKMFGFLKSKGAEIEGNSVKYSEATIERKNKSGNSEEEALYGKKEDRVPISMEGQLAVEPSKPISEMNSQELYDYAQQVKETLKTNKNEDVIDNVADLKDISTKVNFVENSENINDLANSVKSAVRDMSKENPSDGSLAILNAAKKKAIELGIQPQDLIKEVLKKTANDFKDKSDAEFAMKTALEKLTQKSETKPITQNEEAKTTEVETKPSEVTQPTETPKVASFSTKARDLAARIRKEGITPDFLKVSDPNVKISGISDKQVSEALATTIEFIADAVDAGTDLAKAISDGFDNFKKVYIDNNEPFDEAKIKAGFTAYANTQFKEPDIKATAESIRKDEISYNDAIEGQNQDFIDNLNKELFGSKKFNFDIDRFKEQVRKQKSFGLTEEQVIELMGAAKKLTKAQKALIAEVFSETAETDKIAKELQEAFKQLAKGEKPKSVLKRLSVSNVTQLVNALKDALTYTAVSNDQLDKMADFIVDSIDLSKADQYVNAMVSNSVADVRQLLRAKLIVALQKGGNKDLATQLIKDLADEATQSGRQTQSLKRAYEILGAQGNPATRTEFARRAAEAVQQKAAQMTQAYANALSEKEAEIGKLNERLHQKAQASPLITKIKDVISTLCGLRNKSK